ncbi:uncharacterized protein LOC110828631 [Zootermopsis nevadensis]|uniref:uncharacterized protein LOC110828631 n=1 Tax=Zootermopsis nevadensis TaxID=136037 RepID=UPI000B8E36ED|nr:uncharacterized protein LOC110828631 [Zootermopsis nevadensis]
MSLPFRLNVIESKARIMGPADLYVKTGSSVTLACVICQGPHDLGTVFWYRGAAIIQQPVTITDQAQPQPRVVIETDWTDHLTSRLHISKARPSDSGNYTCIPTIAEPASVNVHVINGEHPAAMQHGNKNSASVSISVHIIVYSFTVFLIKRLR